MIWFQKKLENIRFLHSSHQDTCSYPLFLRGIILTGKQGVKDKSVKQSTHFL